MMDVAAGLARRERARPSALAVVLFLALATVGCGTRMAIPPQGLTFTGEELRATPYRTVYGWLAGRDYIWFETTERGEVLRFRGYGGAAAVVVDGAAPGQFVSPAASGAMTENEWVPDVRRLKEIRLTDVARLELRRQLPGRRYGSLVPVRGAVIVTTVQGDSAS